MAVEQPDTLISRLVIETGKPEEYLENLFEDIVYTMLQGESRRKIKSRLEKVGVGEALISRFIEAAEKEYDKKKDTVTLQSKSGFNRKYLIAGFIFLALGIFQIVMLIAAPEYFKYTIPGGIGFTIWGIYFSFFKAATKPPTPG